VPVSAARRNAMAPSVPKTDLSNPVAERRALHYNQRT
jgi:hypothetical protein